MASVIAVCSRSGVGCGGEAERRAGRERPAAFVEDDAQPHQRVSARAGIPPIRVRPTSRRAAPAPTIPICDA